MALWPLSLCGFVILSQLHTLVEPKKTGQHIWSKEEFPNMPNARPQECGREKAGSVCDPNNILNKTDYERIDKAIEDLKTHTKCPCANRTSCSIEKHGYSVGVAIVKRMAMPDKTTDDQVTDYARIFAEYLLNKWSLGQCKDDIVIFISDIDNRFYTVVGETTAHRLNYARLQDLYMAHRNDFLNRNYGDGLVSLINTYKDTLITLEKPANTGIPAWAILIIVGILVIFGIIVGVVFLRQGAQQKRQRKATQDRLGEEKHGEVIEPLAGPSHTHNSSYEAKSEDGH